MTPTIYILLYRGGVYTYTSYIRYEKNRFLAQLVGFSADLNHRVWRKGKCVYIRRDRAVACAYKILLCRLTVVGRELADCRVFIYFIHTDGWRNRLRVFLRLSVFTSIRPDENNHRGRPELYTYALIIYYIYIRTGRGNAAFGRPSVRPSKDAVCVYKTPNHTHTRGASHRKWRPRRAAKAKGFRCASFRPHEF